MALPVEESEAGGLDLAEHFGLTNVYHELSLCKHFNLAVVCLALRTALEGWGPFIPTLEMDTKRGIRCPKWHSW